MEDSEKNYDNISEKLDEISTNNTAIEGRLSKLEADYNNLSSNY